MRSATALRRYVDPVHACVTTVTGLLLLSIVCTGFVLWKPLGFVALVLAIVIAAPVHRGVATYLQRRRLYLAIAGIAAIASVPFAMTFLHTDLRAMAATATANAQWHGPDTNAEVLHSLYGASPSWPSYESCQRLQNATSRDLANGCYSAVGYLRSWQIPSAIPMLFCLTGLYCGIPLFVARRLNQSPE
ncbi:MAG: hypothetical protein LLG14_13635 [Nocardiaceae bacterium]|nr:hypothetical protein [Nocardiaceae bacterium]